MKELIEELKALLEKHKAAIAIEQAEDDSFLYLNLELWDENGEDPKEVFTVDSGYKCISINPDNLKKYE